MSDKPKQTLDKPAEDSVADLTGVTSHQDEDTSDEKRSDDEMTKLDTGEQETEVAEWADEDDLQALAEEQASRVETAGAEIDDIAPLEETLDVGPVESRIEERPLDWYILKVQSNREDSIAAGLQRRVKVAGLEEHFQEIIVPVEMVTEFKGGKKTGCQKEALPRLYRRPYGDQRRNLVPGPRNSWNR